MNGDLSNIADVYGLAFWVACLNGTRVVGMVGVQALDGAHTAELRRMHIASDCRAAGIGSALLDTVLRYCRRNEITTLSLSTPEHNTGAVAFYRKHGFELLPRRDRVHDTTEFQVYMMRALAAQSK